jgi:hypothetical protein
MSLFLNPQILSLGAGVQSSTMALMAAKGEISPMPKFAVFADTQDEPQSVYTWLDWLEKQLPFPVIRASRGQLSKESLIVKHSKSGNNYTQHSPPAFIIDADGKKGMLMRQCTLGYKLNVIFREVRKRIGRKKDAICDMWIGISLDEVERMKHSRKNYIRNRYPLIDLRMTRQDCLRWMTKNGYPTPPRSACVYCPYRKDQEWERLKTMEPKEFEKAIHYEKALQKTMSNVSNFRGVPFLHRSCVPLDQVNFIKANEPDLFTNECEGLCGV